MKLVSLYKSSVKISSKNIDNIFTVNDLVKKNQHQSQCPLAFGKSKLKVLFFVPWDLSSNLIILTQ